MVKRASQKTACKLLNKLFNNSCLHHKFLFSNAENYGKQQKSIETTVRSVQSLLITYPVLSCSECVASLYTENLQRNRKRSF